MTSSNKPLDLATLDAITGGAFQAVTSAERSNRLREWLLSDPSAEVLAEVYREMSTRDKGAAKLLKEKREEIKRVHGQEVLATDWAQKAEHILQAPSLNIADAIAGKPMRCAVVCKWVKLFFDCRKYLLIPV